MPIAVLFDAFPAPSETFLRREMEALRARGLDVRPFAWRAGEGAIALPLSSAPVSRLARRIRGEAWWRGEGARWARAWRERGDFEIEHIHAAWASLPAAWAMGAAHELSVPWSFAAHARDVWVEGGDLRHKLASAAFAVACTRAGAKRLRDLSPRSERVLYAPHGLPLSEWPQRPWQARDLYNPATRPFHILGVGRLVPKKGFDILLRALRTWGTGWPGQSWTATIIGDGPERARLESLSRELSLEARVRFAGAQLGAQVHAAMLEADVLALPCRVSRDGDRDGLPNVLLEAAAIGVPLVVGDAGGVRDLCDDSEAGRNAWLFAPDDDQALRHLLGEAWHEAQQDATPWRAAAERARARVEAEFDIARNISVLAEALARAASANRPLS